MDNWWTRKRGNQLMDKGTFVICYFGLWVTIILFVIWVLGE